jgi:hypothetical protein
MRLIDLTGKRFGELTVVRRDGVRVYRSMSVPLWKCVCDCGNETDVLGPDLRNGHTKSCGCRRNKNKSTLTHGLSKTREYCILRAMKDRCYNKKIKAYPYYGGRGISVCERWRVGDGVKSSVECFLEDMGPRPSISHSVERRDVDGNYEPSNCYWATQKEQCRNRRNTRWVELDGKKLSLGDAIESVGSDVHYEVAACRLAHGWDLKRALQPETFRLSEEHKRNLSIAAKVREARKRKNRQNESRQDIKRMATYIASR